MVKKKKKKKMFPAVKPEFPMVETPSNQNTLDKILGAGFQSININQIGEGNPCPKFDNY